MIGLRDYLISVCAGAIVCGLLTALSPQKGSVAHLMKMLTGLFMTVTILNPIVSLPIHEFQQYWEQISWDAELAAVSGRETAESEIAKIITERSQAYILEKAESLNANVTVDVCLEDNIPCSVRITGAVSPYVKKQLSEYISSTIGIAMEEQQWIES